MDIDSPPSDTFDTPAHAHLILPGFSASYPLPFRVLTLVGLAIFLWAINLQVLDVLGVDAGRILSAAGSSSAVGEDADDDDETKAVEQGLLSSRTSEEGDRDAIPLAALHRRSPSAPASSGAFRSSSAYAALGRGSAQPAYLPVYILGAVYSAWVAAGWGVWRAVTGGEVEAMERWRAWLVVIVLGVGVGVWIPSRGLAVRERRALIASFKRILLPAAHQPPLFCDVILADILTSFAKVLGDLVVSACQIWGGGVSRGRIRMDGLKGWLVLAMVSLPYILRLRQCLHEYFLPSNTSVRPLANALKYASAFPVIFLSAAQRTVVREVAEAKGVTVEELGARGSRWFGEHRLFRMWLLAVVINSMYSFWWDVTNDWGLKLAQPSTWFPSRTTSTSRTPAPARPPIWTAVVHRITGKAPPDFPSPHQRSPCPTPFPEARTQSPFAEQQRGVLGDGAGGNGSASPASLAPEGYAQAPLHTVPPAATAASTNPLLFGLRPILLFPDPLVYHLFTFIDLVLRFTWSLKLSAHLHTISEIESGVFLMEALELGRRWMWVFLRVEWEVVKRIEAERERERERVRALGLAGNGRGLEVGGGGDVKMPIVR